MTPPTEGIHHGITVHDEGRPYPGDTPGEFERGHVSTAMERLTSATGDLADTVRLLEERLARVLLDPGPDDDRSERDTAVKVRDPACAHAHAIQSQAEHVYELNAAIHRLLARLDL